jgi:hypothetical protein
VAITGTTHPPHTLLADAKKDGTVSKVSATRGWKQVTQKIDLETVIKECVLAKRAEHSPRTAQWYELACGYFLQFLKSLS